VASSSICGFTGTLSRSMFPRRTVDSSGLLVPLGMVLGKRGSFFKHRGSLARPGCEVLCDLPRLICRPFGGDECPVSGTTIAGVDLTPDRGLLPEKSRLLAPQPVFSAFRAFSLVP
jgi:hypothetical protein